jgi:hypothetical protein
MNQVLKDAEMIKYPDEDAKNESIRQMIEQGMPPKRSLWKELLTMYRAVGLRGIFFGVEEGFFVGLLMLISMIQGQFGMLEYYGSAMSVLLFISAPVLYSALHLYAALKEFYTGMYELKLTTRYNMGQIQTLRMLVFGGVSLLGIAIEHLLLWAMLKKQHIPFHQLSVLRVMSIMCCAVLVYAAVELVVEFYITRPLQKIIVPAGWLVFAMVLWTLRDVAEPVLMAIPTEVFVLTALCALEVYIAALRKLYNHQEEVTYTHAIS